jgi:PGF-CTERM protein
LSETEQVSPGECSCKGSIFFNPPPLLPHCRFWVIHMNRKTVIALLLSTLIILVGTSESFARPQYLTSLNEVYNGGSCNTCHVMASGSGPQDSNGTYVPRNSNRTNESRNFNRTSGSRGSNRSFDQRNSNRTLLRNSYGTLFENQPDHAADPSAALKAIGGPPTETAIPSDTIVTVTGTPVAPGFGFTVTLVGLFACTLVARRHNK